MPRVILDHGPKVHQGVTTLMAVGRADAGPDGLGAGDITAERLWPAAKTGLVVMGAATLLGLRPGTARLLGLMGLGFRLWR